MLGGERAADVLIAQPTLERESLQRPPILQVRALCPDDADRVERVGVHRQLVRHAVPELVGEVVIVGEVVGLGGVRRIGEASLGAVCTGDVRDGALWSDRLDERARPVLRAVDEARDQPTLLGHLNEVAVAALDGVAPAVLFDVLADVGINEETIGHR